MRQVLLYLLVIFFIFLSSCSDWNLWGAKALGNKFILVNAGGVHAQIIYCTSTTKDCRAGITIVPPKVVECKYDSNWIIAKSKSNSGSTYWMIDKNFEVKFTYDSDMTEKILSHVSGPLDSTNFYSQLKEKSIGLKF
jgi:hypothetical protein